MNGKTLAPLALAALIGVAAIGGTAFAAGGGKEEAQDAALVANAKISLSQAITAAEQSIGGRAFDAGVDNANGKISYSVEVAGSQGVKSVLVDPQTGQVTPAPSGDTDTEQSD